MSDSTPFTRSRLYAGYVLVILAITNGFNSIDRAIIGVLAQPIKAELGVSDAAIGLLTGLGFVLFYALFAIPIARWSDRGVRRSILALGFAFWSATTALCGMASGYVTLLLARICVGIGEAAAAPPALSLIADYFPQERRPRAVAIFQSALFAGLIVGTIVAGWVADRYGWRAAFFTLGIPGLCAALVVRLTIREPERGRYDPEQAGERRQPPLLDALRALLGHRALRLLFAGSAISMISAQAMLVWTPAFLGRVHGLTMMEMGSVTGPMLGLGGFVGVLSGGLLTSYVVDRTQQDRWYLLIPGVALILAAPVDLVYLFSPGFGVVVAAGALQAVLAGLKVGPMLAMALNLVPANVRALSASLMLLGMAVVGQGLGPLAAGIVSDSLQSSLGNEAIRYGMLICPLAVFTSGMCVLAAVKHLPRATPALGSAPRIGARG